MDSSVNVAFLFHFHQPVDNFGWVNEEAYQMSYKPLLSAIEKSSTLKVHLHFTGSLLQWLEEEHYDFLQRVDDLVKAGRVSIIGGGFTEPILSMIPEEFRKKQIHFLRDWWLEKFDIQVSGCWLAERIWEPELAKSLHEAEVDFVFLDDLFIKATGKKEKDTFYTYFTEDQGKGLHVVPINENIRYLIPWKPVNETISYLEDGISENGDTLILIMSDAEKLGLWKASKGISTHEICYKTGYDGTPWLDKLFSMITEHSKMNTILISEYLVKYRSHGLIYIPSASYDKMGVWVLPTDDRRRFEMMESKARKNELEYSKEIIRFAKGSFWRNFLVKYPEVNIMHKRMLNICENYLDLKRVDKKIEMEIMAAQSNDSYWHGMFGGAYFRFLRHSVFKHCINAENLLQIEVTKVVEFDFLKNGRNEIILNSQNLKVFISPFEGGTIFELDDLRTSYNWHNVFSRREEAYHNTTIVTDKYVRRTFRDIFLFSIPENKDITLMDQGNFADNEYTYEIIENGVKLYCIGTIDGYRQNIKLEKTYLINENKLVIKYLVETEELIENIYFAPQLNLTLNSHPHKTRFCMDGIEHNEFIDTGFQQACSGIELIDEYENSKVKITVPTKTVVHSYPVKTLSYTNIGEEEQYQATCINPIFNIMDKLEFQITLQF